MIEMVDDVKQPFLEVCLWRMSQERASDGKMYALFVSLVKQLVGHVSDAVVEEFEPGRWELGAGSWGLGSGGWRLEARCLGLGTGDWGSGINVLTFKSNIFVGIIQCNDQLFL
jgi:hypothetical protein